MYCLMGIYTVSQQLNYIVPVFCHWPQCSCLEYHQYPHWLINLVRLANEYSSTMCISNLQHIKVAKANLDWAGGYMRCKCGIFKSITQVNVTNSLIEIQSETSYMWSFIWGFCIHLNFDHVKDLGSRWNTLQDSAVLKLMETHRAQLHCLGMCSYNNYSDNHVECVKSFL